MLDPSNRAKKQWICNRHWRYRYTVQFSSKYFSMDDSTSRHSKQRQTLPWTLHVFVTSVTFRKTLKKLCGLFRVRKIPVKSQACRTTWLFYLYQPLFILSLEKILNAIVIHWTPPPSKPNLSTKSLAHQISQRYLYSLGALTQAGNDYAWFLYDELFAHTLSCKGIQRQLHGGILCTHHGTVQPWKKQRWEDRKIALKNILGIWYPEHAHTLNPFHPLLTLHCKKNLERKAGRQLLHLQS